ncbi:iduronate-2-sulfatase [Alteromonas aestuariivivens]|uniref:Iduronate-2-sulfatase n=1 Tax=Alteromonas aestuariivivens TaxID=1938339 RepID=A0A3D8MFE3_9ALTE|nr:sulfatase [Alteromonas aestuariivivens]RDV29346.1 iduronate-2-sulfatase [Alteromonas aestuariivivens]
MEPVRSIPVPAAAAWPHIVNGLALSSRRGPRPEGHNAAFGGVLAAIFMLLSISAGAQPLNVVVIITDDQNDWSFNQLYPGVVTPSLDALARQSLILDHAYTASPVCGPSRAAFFSGLYPHSTGAYLNGADPWRQGRLQTTETLPELFKRNGYMTLGAGKLFHAKLNEGREANVWDNAPFHGGFGPYPEEAHRIAGRDEPADTVGAKFWGVQEWSGPDEDFPDVVNANRLIDFFQQSHEKPFMAVYGLWRPHTPFTAPKRFFDLYDPAKIQLPTGYRSEDLDDVPYYGHKLSQIWGQRWQSSGAANTDNWRRILHGYLAATSFADWNVGRVIEALDNSAYANNTLVLFWSDNGFHLGEKNHFEKATVWERSAHIPALIRLPGHHNAGQHVLQPVSNIDFYPTILDYTGLAGPAHKLDGESLRPLLEKPRQLWARPAITTYGENVYSARDYRYRYIQYPDGSEELYDLQLDPHEFRNLADKAEFIEVKKRLAAFKPNIWAESLGGRNG